MRIRPPESKVSMNTPVSLITTASIIMWAAAPIVAQDSASPASVQDSDAQADDAARSLAESSGEGWRFSVTPYLWIPAQEGDVSVMGQAAPVDLSVGDTFDTISDNFNFAALLHAEASRGDLTLFADAMYISLENDGVPLTSDTATVRQDQGVFELGAAYRLVGLDRSSSRPGFSFEPLGGVRMQSLELEIDPRMSPGVSRDRFWIDGFAGARARIGLNEGLALRLRADAGAGHSDFTWSALAGLDIALTDHASLVLGYRTLTTDYDDGHGESAFVYDMTLHGPFAALTITF